MVDHAHSTPASEIHELSGSTPPGAGPVMQPFGIATSNVRELPDTFLPLGAVAADVAAGLAGRRTVAAQPDTDVIDLAGRVKALAERDNRAHGRLADVSDHIQRRIGFPPKRPAPPIGLEIQTEIAGDLHRTIMTRPLETPERDAILAAHDAAVADYDRRERDLGNRLGLPALERRVSRMFRRLLRWATLLTAMEPQTPAGLKAKAEAQLAVEKAGNFDSWTQDLASSVGRDAVRIATALAEPAAHGDSELLSLIAQHGSALAEWEAADKAWITPHQIYEATAPRRPAELYWRETDGNLPRWHEKLAGSDSSVLIFGPDDVERMRNEPAMRIVEHHTPADWDPRDTVVRKERVPDEAREARRVEILAAWDQWEAALEALRESSGLNAANNLIDAKAEVMNAIEDEILDYLPHTFEGLQAKARWIASSPVAEERANHLLRDLCRMPPFSLAPVAQVTPSREVVETYRTFLLFELRYLDAEVYGEDGRRMGYWLDNPAGSFHHEAAPPSTRAAAVLGVLGLMPGQSAQDQRETAARAA